MRIGSPIMGACGEVLRADRGRVAGKNAAQNLKAQDFDLRKDMDAFDHLPELKFVNRFSFLGERWLKSDYVSFQDSQWEGDNGSVRFNSLQLIAGKGDFHVPVLPFHFLNEGVENKFTAMLADFARQKIH
jgi:hypothetical protein